MRESQGGGVQRFEARFNPALHHVDNASNRGSRAAGCSHAVVELVIANSVGQRKRSLGGPILIKISSALRSSGIPKA